VFSFSFIAEADSTAHASCHHHVNSYFCSFGASCVIDGMCYMHHKDYVVSIVGDGS
jgi:hypothetical protein